MTKPERLYALLLHSTARSVKFRDFRGLLRAFGFKLDRIHGSHHHYTHPRIPFVMTINPDGADAHRYQLRRLLEYVEEYALHIEA